jgi:hypothetical protein
VVAPLTTLGAESSSTEVMRAQQLVASGLAGLESVELVSHPAMLAAVKRARRPQLRACDGDAGCLAELGVLVGAAYSIYGEVGGLGSAQVIYLKLIDVKSAREVRSTVLEFGGSRPAAEESRGAATRLLAPARYIGSLAIETPVRGASIYIDGDLVARTPARPIALSVGAHALRVTHPEYRDVVRFVDIAFDQTAREPVELQQYGAVSGDIRRTGRDAPPGAGPIQIEPAPWYRRWYVVAGGAAVLFVASAVAVSLATDGIDFDREKHLEDP